MNAKLFSIGMLTTIGFSATAQNSWGGEPAFAGKAREGAVGFCIGSKIYVGTGGGNSTYSDFWAFDTVTKAWTQVANFGGGQRYYAVGFSIGNKGYVGTGSTGGAYQDFWEYDPATNTWTQKSNFPGGIREQAVGFSIGDKGYIGTGTDGSSFFNDFYEYDTALDSWTQKANFAGVARFGAVGFSIGNKGYIGTGEGNFYGNYNNDFWEYDPATDTWTQKANFGGKARYEAVGFSIGNKGYIGTGGTSDLSDFWEWNQATNTWTQKTNYSIGCNLAVGISNCRKGYVGTGATGNYLQSFSQYIPTAEPVAIFTPSEANFCVGNCINLTDSSTNAPISWNWTFPGGTPDTSTVQNPTNICYPASGTYTVSLTASNWNCSQTASVMITVNPDPPIPTITANFTTLESSSITGNQWYLNGNLINGATSQFYSVTQNGLYLVCVTDKNGCSSCSAPLDFTTVGIEDIQYKSRLSISPNPFSSETTITTGDKLKDATLSIYNVFGQETRQIHNISGQAIILKRGNMPSGVYFFRLKQVNTTIATDKLVITN